MDICCNCETHRATMHVELGTDAPYENTMPVCDECYDVYYYKLNAQLVTESK